MRSGGEMHRLLEAGQSPGAVVLVLYGPEANLSHLLYDHWMAGKRLAELPAEIRTVSRAA
jgi:hypothetical protein